MDATTKTGYLAVLLFTLIAGGCSGDGGGGDPPSGAACSSPDVSELQVTGTTPASGASNVSVNTQITATFNGCVDMSTVGADSFVVTGGTSMVSGKYALDSASYTVSFTPSSPLSYDAAYLVAISDTVKGANGESFAGTGWGFFTRQAPDSTAPVTTASVPAGSYNTAQSVELSCDDGSTGTGCQATYYTTDGSEPTRSSTVYTGAIAIDSTTTLKYFSVDVEGNSEAVNTAEYIIDTTPPEVTGSTPADTAVDVALTTAVSISFNEPILESTLTGANFSLDNGVTGTITYDASGDTVTLTPYERLQCNTLHTVTVGTGVTDLAGNALAAPVSLTFTTNSDCSEPVTSADIEGGVYSTGQSVTLSCSDGGGSGCARIVYTTDGSQPSLSPQNGTVVTGGLSSPISIGLGDTVLRYFAEDLAGNREVTKVQRYSISDSGYTFVTTYSGISRGAGSIPESFVNFGPPGKTNVFHRDPSNGLLYRGTDWGLFISDDDGLTWWEGVRMVEGSYYALSVTDVVARGSLVYIGTTSSGFYISTDGGATAEKRYPESSTSEPGISGVHVEGENVYLATSGDGVVISRDKGHTFTKYLTGTGLASDYVYDVVASGETVYAGTRSGLSISTDGGQTYTTKTTDNGLVSNDVQSLALDGGTLYVGTSGGLSMSSDGGATFVNKTSADGMYSSNVKSINVDGTVIYLATGTGVSVTTDGGNTFITGRPATWNTLGVGVNAVYGAGGRLMAGGYPSYYESADGGATWEQKGLPDGQFEDIVRADDGTVYFHISNSSGYTSVVYTKDYGETFVVRNIGEVLGSSSYIDQLAIDGNMLYVATTGLAATSDGDTWRVMTKLDNGLNAYDVDGVWASGNTIYAISGGSLDLSTDGGANFAPTGKTFWLGAGPVVGPAASGGDVYIAGTYNSVDGVHVSTDDWETFVSRTQANGLSGTIFESLAVDSAGNVYVAILNDGIYRSIDKGTTFEPLTALPSSSQRVSTCGGDLLYVGTHDSGLQISTDAGDTFVQRTTAHGLGFDGTSYACYAP